MPFYKKTGVFLVIVSHKSKFNRVLFPGGVVDMWLNGEVVGSCPGQTYFCFDINAANGNGLNVNWPSSTAITSPYSRLYKGALTEKSCIIVETSERHLWATDYCDTYHFGICVKRDCIFE